jgi:hypothetical protein
MFSKKIQYCEITIKSLNKPEIKLSQVKGQPLSYAIDEFNSHIRDTNNHIKHLFCPSIGKIIPFDTKIQQDSFFIRS